MVIKEEAWCKYSTVSTGNCMVKTLDLLNISVEKIPSQEVTKTACQQSTKALLAIQYTHQQGVYIVAILYNYFMGYAGWFQQPGGE